MENISEEFNIIDSFLEELLPYKQMRSVDFVQEFLLGNWVLKPEMVLDYVKKAISDSFGEIKHLFVSMLLIFILSSLITTVTQTFTNSGLAKSSKFFFIVCELLVLVGAVENVIEISTSAINKMIGFVKITIPAYMICVAAAGASLSAAVFYKLLLGFICLIEGIIISAITPLIEGYMLFGVMESIFAENRFRTIMDDIRKVVVYILKGLVMIVSTSGALQIIITPAIDKSSLAIAEKTASAIPIIGDIAQSLAGVTIISAVTLKNSVGVLILIVISLCVLAPMVKIVCILGAIRLSAAIGGIGGDSHMVDCAEYMTDAGYLYLKTLITIGALFFVAIAALTGITGGS